MARQSAGLLVHRRKAGGGLEVLIVHPGGPFWHRRDAGAWSVPKGEYADGEVPLAVARREFAEELGQPAPAGDEHFLGEVRQAGGKRVSAWAVAGDLDVTEVHSNTFELEWPRGSGTVATFPEVDRAEWCSVPEARRRLVPAQVALLDALVEQLGAQWDDEPPAT